MNALSYLRSRPARSRVLHVNGSPLVPAVRSRYRSVLL